MTKDEVEPEIIGTQLFYLEVACYKQIVAAIKKIEARGMTVMHVTPLSDYDVEDGVTAIRAVIITVAVEAKSFADEKTNVGKKDSNTA